MSALSFPIPDDDLLIAVLARPLAFGGHGWVAPAGTEVGIRASAVERGGPFVVAYGGRSGRLSSVIPLAALLVP